MRKTIFMLTVAATCIAGPASAGTPEVYCFGGVEMVEAWPSATTFGVVAGVDSDGGYLPGFPSQTCMSGIPAAQRPGLQSITRAAKTWTDVAESTCRHPRPVG